MAADREIQKQIAEEAQLESATAASPLVRAFQFFLVPLFIVGGCVLVYALFNYLLANPRDARSWINDVKQGGPGTRPHAALQLVQAIRRMEQPDPLLTSEIMALFRQTPEDPDQKNFNLHRYLASCLGHLRDSQAGDLLLEAVKGGKNNETRAAALDALGTIKDPGTLPELVKLLDAKEPLVRKYAAFNVGAVAEKARDLDVRAAAIEALRKRLADPVADVGWNAAFALAYFLRDRSGTDTLKKMLDRKYLEEKIGRDDINSEVLKARALFTACNGSARLKDESFLPFLRDLTDDAKEKDSDVRFAAHQAINKIREK
jgi:HEAT repeat protein